MENNNLDNELNIEKYNMKLLKFRGSNNNIKHSSLFEKGLNKKYVGEMDLYDDTIKTKINIFKNKEIIDLRTEEEIEIERDFWRKSTHDKMFSNGKSNTKELEYWRNIFPTKPDSELEEYKTK